MISFLKKKEVVVVIGDEDRELLQLLKKISQKRVVFETDKQSVGSTIKSSKKAVLLLLKGNTEGLEEYIKGDTVLISESEGLTYGIGEDYDLSATNVESYEEETSMKLRYEGSSIPLRIHKGMEKEEVLRLLSVIIVSLQFSNNALEVVKRIEEILSS